MSRLPWALLSIGRLCVDMDARPKHDVPLRTVYNAQTRQYEAVPLTEFQQLLHQVKIQETIRWGLCGEPPKRIYRLV